ncbi:hypothetical protein [Mycobacterium sp. NAZ190054]|uniref:hypothetical protein n=1 Tax=Mycobacterium sp. NAZ190054 TaxID=1747766 RepID=UPI000AFF2318|nr:hypothetical protein [Mycobacterium sp. NAZ190054]
MRDIAAVVPLDGHPAFSAAERRAQEFEEAMRRHPAFQSRMPVRMPAPAPPLRRV